MGQIPTFIINGFLDSGKTSFIINTFENDGFGSRGKTLLVLCEEGEVEYPEELLVQNNIVLFRISSEKDFSSKIFDKAIKEHKPNRIVIEMNGMWDVNNLKFPGVCRLAQLLLFIDFTTFGIYFNNMRQRLVDMMKVSDIVIFNRVNNPQDLTPYQVNLKMINSQGQILIMDENFEAMEAYEDPLPYDIDAEVIKIEDQDFGRFYIDTFDNKERYDGKVVELNAMVILSKQLPEGTFIAGRKVMTCCSDDIQLYGHLCDNLMGLKLKNNSWIHLTARISYQFSEEYQEEELVFMPIKITPIDPIKNQVLDFR